jgi:NAD(P)-dependent dehydrogenase (short-subunit alcohol dehydrogenase family)
MKTFNNKVAIVTGGGGDGIGHHLVVELARRGAKVAFCDIANRYATEAQLTAIKAD